MLLYILIYSHDLAGKPGVLSVFPNQVLNLHTTHSWEYLEKVLAMPGTSNIKPASSGADVIIGFLDTGIMRYWTFETTRD